MTAATLKRRITEIFENLFPTATEPELDLVPRSLTDGKMYEAYILAVLSRDLVRREGMSLRLLNGNFIQLKSGCGGINRTYPRIEAYRGGRIIGELWTDIEFLTLSFSRSARSSPRRGHFHELDIVMVTPGVTGRPTNSQVLLGAECKNLMYEKGLLKEILGVRRELSLLQKPQRTVFNSWPRISVPADPASCLLVYASSEEIMEYSDPGEVFGIDFFYEPLPTI